jgi:hypothetical protein
MPCGAKSILRQPVGKTPTTTLVNELPLQGGSTENLLEEFFEIKKLSGE